MSTMKRNVIEQTGTSKIFHCAHSASIAIFSEKCVFQVSAEVNEKNIRIWGALSRHETRDLS